MVNGPRSPAERVVLALLLLAGVAGLAAIAWLTWPPIRARQDSRAAPSAASAEAPSVASSAAPAGGPAVVAGGGGDSAGRVTLLPVGGVREVDPRELASAVPLKVPRIPEEKMPSPPTSAVPEEEAPAPAGLEKATSGPGAGAVAVEEGPLVPPVLLRAAWLPYPPEARRRRSEGKVEVRILVSERGEVSAVELAAAARDTSLARAALESARSMTFRPASRGGRPVAVWFNYCFAFSLPRPG